jgi:hypothetical protein
MFKKFILIAGVLLLVISSHNVNAQLPFIVDVSCHPQGKIGNFEITTYEESGTGVRIVGCFRIDKNCDCCVNYRFLQIVYLIDDMPLHYNPYPDSIACELVEKPPVPFIDAPKLGYCEAPFDNDPWYNETWETADTCNYPYLFKDRATVIKAFSLKGPNRVRLETWVVCFREKTICGLAHIRWGYDRDNSDVVTKIALDGVNHLSEAEINTALSNGLFSDWSFTNGSLACCPPQQPECFDGIDNDGNGCADYPTDTGCSSSSDNSEAGGTCQTPNPQCSDGIDNDGNGCADYPTDTGCSSPQDNSESGGACQPGPDGAAPTLTPYGFGLLILLVAVTGVWLLRRRLIHKGRIV